MFLLTLSPSCLVKGQEKPEGNRRSFFALMRDSVERALEPSFDGKDELSKDEALSIALRALRNEASELRSRDWAKEDIQALNDVEAGMRQMILNSDLSLEKKKSMTPEEAVQVLLVNVLEGSYIVRGRNRFSDYRFLMGGSWTHTDSEGVQGIFTAAMFVRTRLWNEGGEKIENITLKNERSFLDLLIDAQFITNQAFNQATLTHQGDSVATLFLKAVRSSRLSMGLFFATPIRFADYGTLGPVARFEISTQEGSGDIFRRLELGIRLENRSELLLYGSSAQLGFVPDKATGSLEHDTKRILGLDRILLEMEVPLTTYEQRWGFYFQFHGEWPLGDVSTRKLAGGGEGKIAPPLYQFRLGATFDPVKIFGPLFGVTN